MFAIKTYSSASKFARGKSDCRIMLESVPRLSGSCKGTGDGCALDPLLHNPMAAALTDRGESVPFENPANFLAREDSQSTQPGPQFG